MDRSARPPRRLKLTVSILLVTSAAFLSLAAWQLLSDPRSGLVTAQGTVPVRFVAWGYSFEHGRGWGLLTIGLPSGESVQGVRARELSDVDYHGGYDLGVGAARGNRVATPTAFKADYSKTGMILWSVDAHGAWKRIRDMQVRGTGRALGVTMSPNGRWMAYYSSSSKGCTIFRLDWQERSLSRVTSAASAKQIEQRLACGDDGTVYVWQAGTGRDLPGVRAYDTSARVSELGSYDQILTNRRGAFGIHRTVNGGALDVDIVQISKTHRDGQHLKFEYSSPGMSGTAFLDVPYYTFSDLVCSDDGDWWLVTAFERSGSVAPAAAVWRGEEAKPYYVYRHHKLKGCVPLGLAAERSSGN